ncbi:Hypothetical predicted protein [Podarcis lilfordi]|uniref:Phosphofurin acidic cluster sorting protein 2 n=1 Tax=Podarcis lilfordi TaxID=74358 RepID=A0AA35K440_9SAUR|nr:Hypothetical predicted protein [Podarcis lilfordi]
MAAATAAGAAGSLGSGPGAAAAVAGSAVPAPGPCGAVSGVSGGLGPVPVPMNLFATWEIDRSAPSCVPSSPRRGGVVGEAVGGREGEGRLTLGARVFVGRHNGVSAGRVGRMGWGFP